MTVHVMVHNRSSSEVLVPRLKAHRIRLALSQEDLAAKAGLGRQTVARGERDLPIRPSSVRKLARALKVSPQELQRQEPPAPF